MQHKHFKILGKMMLHVTRSQESQTEREIAKFQILFRIHQLDAS